MTHLRCRYCAWTGYRLADLIEHFRVEHARIRLTTPDDDHYRDDPRKYYYNVGETTVTIEKEETLDAQLQAT